MCFNANTLSLIETGNGLPAVQIFTVNQISLLFDLFNDFEKNGCLRNTVDIMSAGISDFIDDFKKFCIKSPNGDFFKDLAEAELIERCKSVKNIPCTGNSVRKSRPGISGTEENGHRQAVFAGWLFQAGFFPVPDRDGDVLPVQDRFLRREVL